MRFAVQKASQINAGVKHAQSRNQEKKTRAQGKTLAVGPEEIPLAPNAQTVIRSYNRQKQDNPVMLPKPQLHGQHNGDDNAGDIGKVRRKRHGVFDALRHKKRLIAR